MSVGEQFVKLLGHYALHSSASEKGIFHERMVRCVEELQIPPIEFKHPLEDEITSLFDPQSDKWTNLILTGEAGVGKTSLVHKVFKKIGGTDARLKAKGTHWTHEGISPRGTKFRAYVNRDLSASRRLGAEGGSEQETAEIERMSRLLLGEAPADGIPSFFVLAANDGQLLKAWRDHSHNPKIAEALTFLQKRLSGGAGDDAVRIFHLASLPTDVMLALCLDAVLNHPGWNALDAEHSGANDLFAPDSPLRRNYLALQDPIVRKRLLDLAKLCFANDWHLPLRNLLAIISNALLGVSDHKMSPTGIMDVDTIRRLLAEGRPNASNFFANILGLNLDQSSREKTIGPLESFRVGLETLNQADNLILFGPDDDDFKGDYRRLFTDDSVFAHDRSFEAHRTKYLKLGLDSEDAEREFRVQLIAQRRRLFFRTPGDMESQYNPWGLTNFHHAQEYLEQLLAPAKAGRVPRPKLLGPLILALNRVWTGLLLEDQDQLFVTTALDLAIGTSSEIEVRRIPAKSASGGELPYIDLILGPSAHDVPRIAIFLRSGEHPITLPLTLTRFEFLRRVADGALPASFSRECSEDIRALKRRLLANLPAMHGGSLRLLQVNRDGRADNFTLTINEA
jgi:DNA polymerase III delta prime subunit